MSVIVFGDDDLCECFDNIELANLFKRPVPTYNEKIVSKFTMKFGKFKGVRLEDLKFWYVESLLKRNLFGDDSYSSNKNIRKYLKQRYRDESIKK